MKYIKKYLFLVLLGIFFCFPKDTKAYQVQAYWASDNWQVQGICQDTECLSSTGAYIQHPSYHCLTTLGIEFEGSYLANHKYHNDIRITIPSSNSIAPWQNLTGQDLGWYPYGQPTNFTRETLTPASPSNPQYYPNNFLDRTYNLSYDFTPSSNITKFGYYFYFNNNNCQNIGGVRVLYYNTTDLSAPTDDNESIIQNQNKNTNDIINNQNQNQQETNEKLDNVNESLEDIEDSLTDDTVPSSNDFVGFTEDLNDIVFTNPLGTLMTLPITLITEMYSQFVTGSDDGCSSVKLIDFSSFTHNNNDVVYLPCFNGSYYFGHSIWEVIDYLMSFYMFYNIVMLFINVYQDISTLSLGTSSNANTTSSTSPYGRLKH